MEWSTSIRWRPQFQVRTGGALDLAGQFIGAGVGRIGVHVHLKVGEFAGSPALGRHEAGGFHERGRDGGFGFGPGGLHRAA